MCLSDASLLPANYFVVGLAVVDVVDVDFVVVSVAVLLVESVDFTVFLSVPLALAALSSAFFFRR